MTAKPMDFKALPKIDLHVHLDGALRPSTVADLIRATGRPVPPDVESLCRVAPDCRSLPEFLKTFEFFLPYLGSTDALRRAAAELCEDQAADNVVYFETRFAPTLWLSRGFKPEQAIEAAIAGLEEGAKKTGVKWGLILCGIRDFPPETTLTTVRLAHRYLVDGVVGVDLAGDERAHAVYHSAAFEMARRLEIPITIHAGEAGPAENVRQALDFDADRIGHGIHAADDPAILARAVKREATFEMCLTSNLQTRCVASLDEHPFARFLREGVRVTLNTDDPGVQGSTLSQDYALAAKQWGLTKDEFRTTLLHGAQAAFADDSLRAHLRATIEAAWK